MAKHSTVMALILSVAVQMLMVAKGIEFQSFRRVNRDTPWHI